MLAAGLTTCLSLGLAVAPAATGDPQGNSGDHQHAFPSKDRVDRARADARQKAHDVSVIKARMLLADQRLAQADTKAEQASEAYNGAMWRLQQAKQRYHAAQVQAARARRTVVSQRDRIGALVAQSYQEGGDLTALHAMLGADGPNGVLDQYAAFQGASSSLQADYQRFAASDALARVFERKAQHAKAEQVRRAGQARAAKAQAVAAAQAAQAEASSIAAQKNQLVRELAQAQNISVSLARQRQTALAEIARKRAEERARRAAAIARAKARAEARAQAEARAKAEAAREARAARHAAQSHHHSSSGSSGGHTSSPPPAPAPAPPPPPSSGGGASQAIAFAKAQLGEPYQWGAAGPSSWDCSGLTMEAWASAGKYLPHYSVAQYESGTPIPVSSARAGDLLFWSSNGAPSGIHHVALYLGGGSFIEAPHTGAYVRYNSIYSWYPDFAVRL